MAQVRGHAEVIGTLLDHGADVNKMNDEGVTALSATLTLLLGDGSAVRRPDLTPPGAPPARDQVDAGSRTAVDSATITVGRLNVTRANRAAVNDLLNDVPIPPPTIYFDASGQIQTLGDAKDQKTMDPAAAIDHKAADQKTKRATAIQLQPPSQQQQQQQQQLKPPSAAGGGSVPPSPSATSDVGSLMSADRSNLPVGIDVEEEQR